jgi:hypothetical protein
MIKTMKTYLVINGKNSFILLRLSLKDVKEASLHFCDCSKEIIVREIETITLTNGLVIDPTSLV